MAFVKFMTSGVGRAARVVLGLVILSVGLFVVKGVPGSSTTPKSQYGPAGLANSPAGTARRS